MPNVPSNPPNDRSGSRAWLGALEMTSKIEMQPLRIFPRVVEALGESFGAAPALFSAAENFSHAQLAARLRRYAGWALAQGVKKGDVVALLMHNRAEYLAIWLGIARVGGIVALINTNLGGPALAHCLAVANPRHIIADERSMPALAGTGTGARIWRHDVDFLQSIAALSDAPLVAGPDVTLDDPALLIFTSGTTGLPKAAHVSHHRVMMWTHWFAGMMAAQADDRLYNCLPMYHSVGGVVASGAVLLKGGAVILREKFSARAFWDDIADGGATIFQYIGELCRYLLKSSIEPRAHRLRLACGNGLSGDIWEPFQQRFAIPRILEFYAATEGNFSLYNAEGKPGAIGRIPGFLRHRFGVALIRRGQDGEPLREADGFCRRVATGEAGEAVGRIAGGAARFEGYSDEAATTKKILRGVFEPGDAYVRTGDLMRQDAQGFFYFVDRLGDTFRWKGENVATTEVAAVLGAYPGIIAANVYGVSVPGADGKAGMAALETGAGFDLAGLKAHLKARLPEYARPIFLRLSGALAVTETFKQKKSDLASEGFDPSRIGDLLYADLGDGYISLDAALHERLSSGLVRL